MYRKGTHRGNKRPALGWGGTAGSGNELVTFGGCENAAAVKINVTAAAKGTIVLRTTAAFILAYPPYLNSALTFPSDAGSTAMSGPVSSSYAQIAVPRLRKHHIVVRPRPEYMAPQLALPGSANEP